MNQNHNKSWKKSLFFIMFAVLSFCSTTATLVHAQAANQDASTPPYELLVLPRTMDDGDFDEVGLLAGDFVGRAPSNALTDEQLSAIHAIDGVSVAAPFSVIGYFVNRAGGIDFKMDQPERPIRLSYDIRYHDQTILSKEAFIFPVAPESTTSLPSTSGIGIMGTDGAGKPWALVEPFLLTWNLLVGVDPEAENTLTGIKDSVIRDNGEHYFTVPQDPCVKGTSCKIPLLVNSLAYQNMTLEYQIESIDLT